MNKALVIFYFLSILTTKFVMGQCTDPDVTVSDEVCQNAYLQIDATDNGDYLWDFCAGEMANTPSVTEILNDSQFNRIRGIKVFKDNGIWYLLAINNSSNDLTVVTFGPNLSEAPSVVYRIDLSSYTGSAFDVDYLIQGNKRYAFIAATDIKRVLRLDFGSSWQMPPEVNLLDTSFEQDVNAISILKTGSDIYGFVSTNNSIIRLDFGSDPEQPSPAVSTQPVIGSGVLRKSRFIEFCGVWQGFVVDYTKNSLHRISFSDGTLSSAMQINEVNNIGDSFDFPSGIDIGWDGDSVYFFVIGARGRTLVANTEKSLIDEDLEFESLGTLGLSESNFAFDLIKDGPYWYAYSVDLSRRLLIQYTFPSDCDESQQILSEPEPLFKYNSSGIKNISVEKIVNGQLTKRSLTVTVQDEIAPEADFEAYASCVSIPVDFTYPFDDPAVSEITWNFGDGANDSGKNVSHLYSTEGEYRVELTVISNNGCTNTFSKRITVLPGFTAEFSMLSDNACTNSITNFENQISDNLIGFASNEWSVNGSVVSNEQNLEYQFQNNGEYVISLTTTVGACNSTVSQTITVFDGPLPSFTVEDGCQNSTFQFNNTSTGQVDSFLWDFDNGITSTLENPTIEFDESGQYQVSLTLTNTAGCVSTFTQAVTVYALPTVSFSNELACERTATLFRDESFAENANIVSWDWDFGDPDSEVNSADTQETSHVFSTSGTFDVTLTVTTNFGCISSEVQQVTVLESPTAAFSYDLACIGEPVRFQDNSFAPTGESITSWAWDLGGTFSNQRNPATTFDFARSYDVSLIVTASNQCISTYSEELIIAEAPDVQMDIEQPCTGSPVTFTDITNSMTDPVVSRSWDFGGQGLAEDSIAQFTFSNTGTYQVSLTVVLASGCEFSTSRSVRIDPTPVADFTLEESFGTPPFTINAQNTSQNAASIQWLLEGIVVGTSQNLQYTIEEPGDYELALVASTLSGCRDTARQTIQVTTPDIDISISDLKVVVNENPGTEDFVTLSFVARNQGTIDLTTLPVKVILDADYELTQDVAVLLPSDNSPVPVTLPVRLNVRLPLNVCVEIPDIIMGVPDINLENNSVCYSENQVIVYAPYPNPATDQILMDVLATVNEVVQIDIYSSSGARKFSGTMATGMQGVKTWTIDTSNWMAGAYMIQAITSDGMKYYRFVIQR